MRDKLLKLVERLYIWLLPKTIKAVNTQVIPITRCVTFHTGMNEDQIKAHLVRQMVENIIPYVEFKKEVKADTGTTLIRARLDVVQKINVEGVKIDE